VPQAQRRAGRSDRGLDRPEHLRHQAHRVARRPVLARFLLFSSLKHQFLEDAHRVVVDAGRREVDVGVEELVDQRADGVGPGQRRQLVAEFEVVEDVLDVGREAVEVVLEVGQQALLAAARPEVAQGEPRGVVEGLAGGIAERGVLFGDARASSILRVSSTFCLVGSSTASMRRMTHIGRITSGYLPRLKRSRSTSSAMPQMKETILW
jgi:hypothetical protein